MNRKQFDTYDVKFSKGALTDVITRLERGLVGIDRDLQIMAALSLAVGLSDPTIMRDPTRFSNMLNNLSQYLCWAIQLPETIDSSKAN